MEEEHGLARTDTDKDGQALAASRDLFNIRIGRLLYSVVAGSRESALALARAHAEQNNKAPVGAER